jgi:hypothetical protein
MTVDTLLPYEQKDVQYISRVGRKVSVTDVCDENKMYCDTEPDNALVAFC